MPIRIREPDRAVAAKRVAIAAEGNHVPWAQEVLLRRPESIWQADPLGLSEEGSLRQARVSHDARLWDARQLLEVREWIL